MRVFQWFLFIAMTAVSAFFVVNLAIGLGATPVEKAAMIAEAAVLEAFKAFLLLTANTAAERRAIRKAVTYYLAYGFVAICSLSACLGYTLATVEHMREVTAVVDHETELAAERTALADCDAQISTLRSLVAQRQAALPQLAPERQGQVRKAIAESLNKIDGYQVRKDASVQRMSTWRAQDQQARASHRRSLYDVIGQAIGLRPSSVAFAILAVLSLALELGIFLTSPHGAPEKEQPAVVPATGAVRARKAETAWIQKVLGIIRPLYNPILASPQEPQNCRSPSRSGARA